MINYQTILSSFDGKLTLMQWLKKVEDALKGGSLESVSLSQPTATTAVLTFHFADGSSLESPTLVLPQGPQGPKGEDGKDGTSVRILPNAESCTELGDGYIDASGHLQVLINLDPRTFEDAGEIRGPQGPAGQDGTDGTDGVSVTNVAVTQTNHLIVTLSNGTTIDAGEIQVSGSQNGFNIINATDIVSNTLTQEQFDLITNGKPTLIMGSFLDMENPIFFAPRASGSYKIGMCFGRVYGVDTAFYGYRIQTSSRLVNINQWGLKIGLDGNNENTTAVQIKQLNGKAVPAFPVDLTKDYLLKQNKTTSLLEWFEFSITDHTGYITLTIGNNSYDIPKYAPTPTTISFSLGQYGPYSAEQNMTFAQWCSSNYNTDGWDIDGSLIVNATYQVQVTDATPNDVIVANTTYGTRLYGG